ncbi:MAG: hypothetical protein ABIR54_07155 [Burkholderiaceae bacterium]
MSAIEPIDRWNIEAIASYLGLTPKHTREAVTTKPSFPKPVVNVTQRTRFWSADEVRRWAASPH